jgi:hypothetical protein
MRRKFLSIAPRGHSVRHLRQIAVTKRFPLKVCMRISLSPRWGSLICSLPPMACAMGCILSPLRGWEALKAGIDFAP